MNPGNPFAAVVSTLAMAFAIGRKILWEQVLGFTLSGAVQALVTKGEME